MHGRNLTSGFLSSSSQEQRRSSRERACIGVSRGRGKGVVIRRRGYKEKGGSSSGEGATKGDRNMVLTLCSMFEMLNCIWMHGCDKERTILISAMARVIPRQECRP